MQQCIRIRKKALAVENIENQHNLSREEGCNQVAQFSHQFNSVLPSNHGEPKSVPTQLKPRHQVEHVATN
jgi:hypothetical protein